ncbi:MAG: hypothetical protein MUE47_01910 [Acidobacteria bacterium]|jgi:hypothetical protein|nr:hypothetical protein [Acidobacteriota bacterium]
MSDRPCDRTATLLAAARAGAAPADLARHAASCVACGQALAIEAALRAAAVRLAAEAATGARLATPGALLFRARHRARLARAARAARPMAWARRAALASAAAAVGWFASALLSAGQHLTGALAPANAPSAMGLALLAIVAAMGAALVVTDLCAPES